MYELIQVSENSYYIQSPAKIGLVKLNDTDVCLIDSGNDKSAGRKIRQILDANGWAVNTQARINIAFGTTLTQLARLPDGSDRALRDPYAPGPRLLPWLLVLLVVVGVVFLAVRTGWLGGAAML